MSTQLFFFFFQYQTRTTEWFDFFFFQNALRLVDSLDHTYHKMPKLLEQYE